MGPKKRTMDIPFETGIPFPFGFLLFCQDFHPPLSKKQQTKPFETMSIHSKPSFEAMWTPNYEDSLIYLLWKKKIRWIFLPLAILCKITPVTLSVNLQDGPKNKVISGMLTPSSRATTCNPSYPHLFKAMYRGPVFTPPPIYNWIFVAPCVFARGAGAWYKFCTHNSLVPWGARPEDRWDPNTGRDGYVG